MKTTPCRGCGKPILWVVTEKGKAMPLDPEPVEAGRVIIRMGPAMGQTTAHTETEEETTARLKTKQPSSRVAFMPHHATCPKASEFSTSKKKTPAVSVEAAKEKQDDQG
jgi:hypothetical protein